MSQRVYRLLLSECPSGDEAREVLELVLAAASLDLKLELVLEGAALGLVWPSLAPGWQQLLDHDLADVSLRPPPAWPGAAPLGVRIMSAERVPDSPPVAIELAL